MPGAGAGTEAECGAAFESRGPATDVIEVWTCEADAGIVVRVNERELCVRCTAVPRYDVRLELGGKTQIELTQSAGDMSSDEQTMDYFHDARQSVLAGVHK